ncbi:exodeoxyribonuclease VII large subunit [Fontivita pretiosa]|uniref:exodeoxyribonuclease VII large subunit n=1 Tax=Fontivita pretiosa TaxID=2989684 RepID=UPI003D166849
MKENFFDFREKLATTKKLAAGDVSRPLATALKADQALTVSQLTAQIERALKTGLPATVYVRGEVSNFNRHRASGHLYFTLKDSTACIDCVMFRSDAAKLKFEPQDGMELLAGGRVAVYAPRGRYQLCVTTLAPLGRGSLELAFQQLCQKLRRQGLFDPGRKKPLPPYPTRIALVTSRSTAALQDMLKVLRRFPWIRLYLYHVPVQGDGSAELIADGIRTLSRQAASIGGIDVIILARGGGSLEDLWAFNEEIVARAIADCSIPIVTGIGHEIDTSIADLVADYHAHTPTEAAQVVTANWKTVTDLIESAMMRLRRGLRNLVHQAAQRLASIQRHEFFRRPTDRLNQLRQLLDDRQRSLHFAAAQRLRAASARLARLESLLVECHPKHLVDLKRQRLTELSGRLAVAVRHDIDRRTQRIESLGRHLEAVSPQSVLRRGYTITMRKKDGTIIRSAQGAKVGERLLTRFADGTIESVVEDHQQLPLFESQDLES